jgi:hypothetical protein
VIQTKSTPHLRRSCKSAVLFGRPQRAEPSVRVSFKSRMIRRLFKPAPCSYKIGSSTAEGIINELLSVQGSRPGF